jgi:deoxyribodipyrimidine photo-lyase
MKKRSYLNPVQIVWFKRDLRVQDHRPLAEAAKHGPMLPIYITEPELWRQPDASARHWQFIAESLDELDADLIDLGQPLIVRVGSVIGVLEAIRQSHGIAALWSHEETGNAWTYARDKEVAAWARSHSIPWHEVPQHGVVRRLGNRNGWATAWDRQMAEAIATKPAALLRVTAIDSQALPSLADLGLELDGCTERQAGGRSNGLAMLASFLNGRGRNYRREMSNPLSGATGCSRLSPHLAWGTLSMREVAQATWRRLHELKGDPSPDANALRASLISFSGRLHWHCHFMQKLESEPAIEFRELHPAMRGLRPAMVDAQLFNAWARGHTGFPFLDACMRSLHTTGWLNFRMRAMVMSFASYNLWLPWRETGLHLARQFTDYEPGIHWPQVQMQSGTTGINTIRIYSVVKQGYDQDPNGAFVRRWVPELAGIPDRYLQEPWAYEGAGDFIGRAYPHRIVDLKASTTEAKDKIYGARRSAGFYTAADAIHSKHGSRKRGGAMQSAKPGKRKSVSPASIDQLKLDL